MVDYVALLAPIPFLLTIFIFSFVYRENLLFRIAEHLAIGIAAGQMVLLAMDYITSSGIRPLMSGSFLALLPLILGIALFCIFNRKYAWVARYPTAMMAGMGIGIAVRGMVKEQFIEQILGAVTWPRGQDPLAIPNYLLGLVSVLTVICYFVFTREHKGVLGYSAKLGRYFILAALGVGYVGYMLGRSTMLIERVTYLFDTFCRWFLGR
jgi:hypothetical protein